MLLAAAVLGLAAGGCAAGPRPGAPYPAFQQYEGWEVRSLGFVGELQIAEDSLRRIILTHEPRCVIPIVPRRICPSFAREVNRLDLNELARDVARLQLYYRDFGYFGTRVVPAVEPLQRGRAEVRFTIAPGEMVTLRELRIEGADAVLDTARLRRAIPLVEGEPFRRSAFIASSDTIRSALIRRGHAYAEVLRNYDLNTVANIAEVRYEVVPGPVARLDTVVVEGNYRLEPATVQRMLGLRRGETINLFALNQSQRFLYGLDIVRFATVELAPAEEAVDAIEADTVDAAVRVRIVEAPRYAADAAAGYGTLDCFRGTVRGTDRNFLGGARRLELVGSVSKIGVGHPLGMGLDESLCRGLREDPYSDTLNYRLSAHFRQPRLFGTANELQARVHAERVSEVQAYARQSVGANLAVTRELGVQASATVTADVQRGYTTADPVVFCATFGVCAAEDLEPLTAPRWSNSLAASALFDRTQTVGALQRGYLLRGSVDWASPVLGSDDRYLGLIAQATAVRPVFRPGWELAGRVQGGSFIDPGQGFIPPQRRFYAGGPTTVRGFQQNTLGPIAYVQRITVPATDTTPAVHGDEPRAAAIGGTRLLVLSAELRTPSPWFRDLMRIAYFVDAGQVWAPETELDIFDTSALRVTPGAGLRFATPVGPIRFDIALGPRMRDEGPLFREEDGALVLADPSYTPPSRGFLRRLVFHIAVGQAF